jgi:DNA-directed RNA polymerase subunit M/transcription elongation factor TFIIS
MNTIDKNEDLIKMREATKNKFTPFLDKDKINQIEGSVYKYVIDYINENGLILDYNNNFKTIYLIKIVSIYNNINPKNVSINNNFLYNKIKASEIDLDKIAVMKPYELFPDKWKRFISKEKASNNYLFKEQKHAETDEFKCMKCKKRRCKYYTIQIRSCDEPETIKIQCLNCGNKWNE